MSYSFSMDTNTLVITSKARALGEAARIRRARLAELKALGSGGALALTGLLLAALYCLLTHRLGA